MLNEHRMRWISALLGLALLFGIYFSFGHIGLVFLVTILSLAAYGEFLSFSRGANLTFLETWAPLLSALPVSLWFSLELPGEGVALYLGALWILLLNFFKGHCQESKDLAPIFLRMQSQLFGFIYLVVFPSFVSKLHALPHGASLLFFLLGIIWLGDSGAYYAGKTFGQHKLSPQISPGKTWEGTVGAFLVCVLFAFFLQRYTLTHISLVNIFVVAFCTSAIAQIGDLLESLMKRAFGVKDSGALIPGHGGVFDRFDSLILAAPFFYFLVSVLA